MRTPHTAPSVTNGCAYATEGVTVDENAKNKAAGKAKEMLGKVTGNDRMKAEGKTDQAKGKVGGAADDARAKAEGVRDSLRDDDR